MKKRSTKSQEEKDHDQFSSGPSSKDKPPRYDRRNNFSDGVDSDPDLNPPPDKDTRYNYRDAVVCLLSRGSNLSDSQIIKLSHMMPYVGERKICTILKGHSRTKKSSVPLRTGILPHDPHSVLFLREPAYSKTPTDFTHKDLIALSKLAITWIDPLVVLYDVDIALRVALDYAINESEFSGQIDAVTYSDILDTLTAKYNQGV